MLESTREKNAIVKSEKLYAKILKSVEKLNKVSGKHTLDEIKVEKTVKILKPIPRELDDMLVKG